MTDKPIELDQHRGMAAQKATELRRLLADVEANEKTLRIRQDELETHLLAAPAANWHEAAEKARYLLNLFASTLVAEDPRRRQLIAAVLADFKRLSGEG
jgi:prolyl-tRNA editing enzyme YbaK/EbsC (Cys-tRNA(Pro) deacylase)